MEKKYKVLFVDDEQNILRAIRRLVEDADVDYEAFFANSGQEALDLLEKNEAHVLVTDMRMPGMDGLALLKAVKQSHPGMVRVVLSGYTQLSQMLATINHGDIFKFITKPWQEQELMGVVKQALDQYILQQANEESRKALERRTQVYQTVVKSMEERANLTRQDFLHVKQVDQWIIQYIRHKLQAYAGLGEAYQEQLVELTNAFEQIHGEYMDTLPTQTMDFSLERTVKEVGEFIGHTEPDCKMQWAFHGKMGMKYEGYYRLLFLSVNSLIRCLYGMNPESKLICEAEAAITEHTGKLVFIMKQKVTKSPADGEGEKETPMVVLQGVSLLLNEICVGFGMYSVLHENQEEITAVVQGAFPCKA